MGKRRKIYIGKLCILSKAINLNRNVIRLDNVSKNTMWKLFFLFVYSFYTPIEYDVLISNRYLFLILLIGFSFYAYCVLLFVLILSSFYFFDCHCSILYGTLHFPLPFLSFRCLRHFLFFHLWADGLLLLSIL